MHHKTLETKTQTTTEQGHFTALAATYAVDRLNDRIIPGAFGKTIEAWKSTGRRVPLHWDHGSSAEDVIGWVDPATMRETDQGLYVEGQLDIETSSVAQEAWRSMKNDALALSFGYLATKQQKAKDGVNKLLELDIFEVSVVAAPANPHTRFLSLKNAATAEAIDPKELRKRTFDAALENAKDNQPIRKAVTQDPGVDESEEEPDEVDVDETKIRALVSEEVIKQVSEVEDGRDEELLEAKSAPQDPLRKRTYEVALGISNGGMKVRKHIEPDPEPEPLDAVELRCRTDRLRLDIASG